MKHYKTAESVTKGHPDKLCELVSPTAYLTATCKKIPSPESLWKSWQLRDSF